MKIILQRVKMSSVLVNQSIVGKIDHGLMLLVGFGKEDILTENSTIDSKMDAAIEKITQLRIFPNELGKLDHSVIDVKGSILAVPQFTLYGEAKKGRRPDFVNAMAPDEAKRCFALFVEKLKKSDIQAVETGVFGADMEVTLVNDGPFTLNLHY